MTVALVMIAKDEADNIGRALQSAEPLIDTWVLLDTGSSDGTPEAAEAATGVPSGGGLTRSSVVSAATNNFTMELWVLPESCTALTAVFYNGNLGSNGWGVLIDGGGLVSYYAAGVAFGAVSATRLTFGAWNHVVVSRDATQWKYWINGVLDTATIGTTAPNTPSGGTTGLGASGANRVVVMAHTAVYNSVLTLAQIKTRYNAAKRGRYGVKVA